MCVGQQILYVSVSSVKQTELQLTSSVSLYCGSNNVNILIDIYSSVTETSVLVPVDVGQTGLLYGKVFSVILSDLPLLVPNTL